jgi:hypothetical protein
MLVSALQVDIRNPSVIERGIDTSSSPATIRTE